MTAPRPSHSIPALLALIAIGSVACWQTQPVEVPESDPPKVAAACDIAPALLERVRNGYYPRRSGDVLMIERLPHQFGTRHSSAHPYTQKIPLVLYGPGYIRAGVDPQRRVTVADLAPTYAKLVGFRAFPRRHGTVLREALLPTKRQRPRLIFTVVWDGGGDNVLDTWPDAWPNLKRLIRRGVSFQNATVGSSPSTTPPVHATIGTGAFPSRHGLTDTKMQLNGRVVFAWERASPHYLEVNTLADLWDRAKKNRPLIGMLARDAWHLGMIGHGDFLRRADKDIAVLDQIQSVEFRPRLDHYSVPGYVFGQRGLARAIEKVDRRDGNADDRWLGNPLLAFDRRIRFTPAWSIFQTKKTIQILREEGFGADRTTDLFYTNYKATDLAGHAWNMTSREERDNLAEQDRQLGVIVGALNRLVGRRNYVLALTADHGQAPYPRLTGGWSIEIDELSDDVDERFDKTPTRSLVAANRMNHLILNRKELKRNDLTAKDVAAFVRNYRIEDNVTSTNRLLPRFEARRDERLFLGALTRRGLEGALRCARRP